jgi:hypothetical protein
MTDEHLQRPSLLILARLASSKRSPPSVEKLEQDLFPFVEARLSRREWSSQLETRLAALRAEKLLDARRVPTPQGLERLRKALGVRELPARWSEIWRALVPALALELPGSQWSEVASADRLRARLIRQDRELSLPELPTLAQAVDAQLWQALDLPGTGPLTLGKLRRALLERTLGTSLRAKSIDAAEVGRWLATTAAGTTTRDIAAIQRALVGRWVFDSAAAEDPGAPEPPRTRERARKPPPASESSSLAGWAGQVQALADATQAGRYGDERVFIAAVWRAAQTGPAALDGSLSAFKARLVEANRASLLRLHRADLVGAMDEQLVRDSETRHLNAIFHFIEIQPRRVS